MSVLWTAADAASATGGRAQGDWEATGLSIDTRSIAPGDLFIALTDRRDGHDFVADALVKGAAAALVARIPEGVAQDAPLLVVDNVQTALEALGGAARARTRARVVGVTGSVGKTSTKEMLRCALGALGRVHAADKSFNNHWGVPLTLARCPVEADYAVIEMGMNHPGEIAPLSALAAPDVAVVTAVAPAHLEAFADGLPGIAREKASIFAGLARSGTAVLNGDLETTPILRTGAAGAARILAFGQGADADARLTDVRTGAENTLAHVEIAGRKIPLTLAAPGRHVAMNAAAVMAVVAALGGDLAAAAEGLAAWRPAERRGTRETLALPGGEAALIDDSYNANPASLGAALDVLAACPAQGRRVAILGDMLELGPEEGALHAALADHPAMAQVDVVHMAGPRMANLREALSKARRGQWRPEAEALAAEAATLVSPGDIVLVKGSLGSRIGCVVDALRKLGQATPEPARGTG